jgi:hypothetical protein
MLDSLLHRFFAQNSIPGKLRSSDAKRSEQVSQATVFTREADVEGWVFLAEERHSEPGSKARSYADVVAGRTGKNAPARAYRAPQPLPAPELCVRHGAE